MGTEVADKRDIEQLSLSIELAKDIITKDYLYKLDEYEIKEIPTELKSLEISEYTRFFKLKKFVTDKKENTIEKLVTVFHAAYTSKASVVALLKGYGSYTEYYLGIVSKDIEQKNSDVGIQGEVFKGALTGNFPGSELEQLSRGKMQALCDYVFADDYITSVSGISSLRGEKKDDFEKFVQGMEHLVDSLQGREYSVIVIADPVDIKEISLAKDGYENLYTQLSPFLETTLSFNESNSISVSKSHMENVTKSYGESTSLTQNYSKTDGWSDSTAHGTSHNRDIGRIVGIGANAATTVLALSGAGAAAIAAVAGIGSVASGLIGSFGESSTESITKSRSETGSVGETVSHNEGEAQQSGDSTSNTEGDTRGRTLQFKNENKKVRNLLNRIDKHLERLKNCEAYGAFNTATYVISSDPETSAIVANGYNALMRGENSALQASYINSWNAKGQKTSQVKEYLKKFSHPLFIKEKTVDVVVSPASMMNSNEMAISMGVPKKSINGLPVIECAEFGRNVISVDGDVAKGDVRIGHIYHMHHVDESVVSLSSDNLTAHTFVTGSTGAGKSNVIYQMLSELSMNHDTKFLVIEPAKGEYKDVFGANKKILTNVYGTNPKLTPLLRVNPFRFPATIHIYEHMDRLIEIFNVCWPMYAAMPAILKAGLEKAYIAAGWDLESSENITGVEIYPTFASVAREIRRYLDSSDYSDENKGDYKGALLTRLESLTNGINGMIFTADDLADEDLFDKNVIVDLSRVGSMETKALIMGILVMRLQEYRSGNSEKNCKLKHVTVLEEAHNLLKRTSSEQNSEGANLLGKSVEMLANSIAEMRTYGEAFIIADQAPGLLDMSVIRNTNTKIILRLPDYEDRALVGRAANLNDEQIEELAKLRTGVAAVYQNNWIEPVLCQFDKYESGENVYLMPEQHKYIDQAVPEILDIIMRSDIRKKLDDVDDDLGRVREKLVHDVSVSKMPDFLKVKILNYFVAKNDRIKAKQLAEIAYGFFEAEKSLDEVKDAKDMEEWKQRLVAKLNPSIKEYDEMEVEKLLAMLVHEHYLTHKDYEPVFIKYMEYLGDKRQLL